MPTGFYERKPKDPRPRFWAKVDRDGPLLSPYLGRCWVWTGATSPKGYGHFLLDGAVWQAHRAAYALFVGPIPEGLTVDHLCRVRNCVNFVHLETVTMYENTLRGNGGRLAGERMSAKTHCLRGHPYDETNTAWRKSARGRPARSCLACNRERDRARWPARSKKGV